MSETTTTIFTFAGVAALVGAIVALALNARRRDRQRVATMLARHGLTTFSGDLDTVLDATAGHQALSHRGEFDPLRIVGIGNVLTRERFRSEIRVKSAHVSPWRVERSEPGVLATLRGTQYQSNRTFASTSTSAKGIDVVVARLRRPIAGEVFLETCEASIDPQRVAAAAHLLTRTGMEIALLDDPDLQRSYISRVDVNELIAADEGLRALLWATQRHATEREPNTATMRYASRIAPMPVSQLSSIHIVDDVLVLAAHSSPFQAGVRNELVELAAHVAARFR